MNDIHTEQLAIEMLLGNLLRNDPTLKVRLSLWLENSKVRSPGYYLAKRVQDIAEAQLRKETTRELNISPAGLAKRLAELEERMDKMDRLIETLATKDDIATIRQDIEMVRADIAKLPTGEKVKTMVNETRDIASGKISDPGRRLR